MAESRTARYNVENADAEDAEIIDLTEAEDRPETHAGHELGDVQRDWETDEWVAICSCGWTSNQRRRERHVMIEWERHRLEIAPPASST